MSSSTPTARRRQLAKHFRDLRRQRGYQLEHVAEAIGSSVSKVSRLEAGLRSISVADVRRLCALYQLSGTELTHLVQIAREGQGRSWWDDGTYPPDMRTYIGIEQAATTIATYSCTIVPGLLQTEAYATALVRGTDLDAEPISRATVVAHRLKRQQLLDQRDPPWVRVVLDEAALRHVVGSEATMHHQLTALARSAQRTRISVQIIPFRAGAHPGLDNRFVMLYINDEPAPDLVHVEGIGGYSNLEKPADLARYTQAWGELVAIALPPDDSVRLLADVATSFA